MKTITLLSQKGGSGKTTLAAHLAAAAARHGLKACIIDADPQGSATDWSQARPGGPLIPVIPAPRHTLHREIGDLAAGYELVVIDGPPRTTDIARSAILAGDLILIPVQPSPLDVWAAASVVRLIDEAKGIKPGIRAAFIINRRIPNTLISRETVDALASYSSIPTIRIIVNQRVGYAEALATGEVCDTEAATLEINALWGAINKL